ncbi:MAG: GDYXXLXY domain-containing protein [Flavobacteriales bacterium]|nr:GDYXXLXY domain-containing protein [Flavobacteriales bacterium]
MTIKKGFFIAFAAIIVLIPVYVALSSQNVLSNGKQYKFKPMAYDPFDPFRGKYLRINYETNFIPTKFGFDERETIYVSIAEDEEGFAYFEEGFKSPPKDKDYLETTVSFSSGADELTRDLERMMDGDEDIDFEDMDTRQRVNIKIPNNMNKYFINEDDALKAERVLEKEREHIYIAVRILDGEARLEDIYVHDQPIKKYLHK